MTTYKLSDKLVPSLKEIYSTEVINNTIWEIANKVLSSDIVKNIPHTCIITETEGALYISLDLGDKDTELFMYLYRTVKNVDLVWVKAKSPYLNLPMYVKWNWYSSEKSLNMVLQQLKFVIDNASYKVGE